MLVLTENASAVITMIVDQSNLPAEGGVRIAGGADGRQALNISTTEAPHASDRIVEDKGARLFLENSAADMLDDKVLDAQVDDRGEVQFLLALQ